MNTKDPLMKSTAIEAGTLFVVATPIGNLGDLSVRAIEILRTVDYIAAEDTRVTGVLLKHIGSSQKLICLNAHNEQESIGAILEFLKTGKTVALVSDAGTPAISDPGSQLVFATHKTGITVVPIPGASAPIALISASGLVQGPFHFEGFLPRKSGPKKARLNYLSKMPHPFVLLEAPHRMRDTLELFAVCLEENRWISVGREITKKFEEIHLLQCKSIYSWLSKNKERGEFCIVVASKEFDLLDKKEEVIEIPDQTNISIDQLLSELLQELPVGISVSIAKKTSNISRAALYKRALEIQKIISPKKT